jgi:hypothetical protein
MPGFAETYRESGAGPFFAPAIVTPASHNRPTPVSLANRPSTPAISGRGRFAMTLVVLGVGALLTLGWTIFLGWKAATAIVTLMM